MRLGSDRWVARFSSRRSAPESGASYVVCTADTDRSDWHPDIARFFDYWLSISPPGLLPGRQHFDPLHIPQLMPRVWMLDVLRDPLRFRYRMAGTKEVETLQREVTGLFFDDVHGPIGPNEGIMGRFHVALDQGAATYRKGSVLLRHHDDHRTVENCTVPLARDGHTVDILVTCSVLFRRNGQPN